VRGLDVDGLYNDGRVFDRVTPVEAEGVTR
jgi:hypothetical protein